MAEATSKPVDRVRELAEKARGAAAQKKQEEADRARGKFEALKTEIATAKQEQAEKKTALAEAKEALAELDTIETEHLQGELVALQKELRTQVTALETEIAELDKKIAEGEADPLFAEMTQAEQRAIEEGERARQEETKRAEQATAERERRETIEAVGNFAAQLQELLKNFEEGAATWQKERGPSEENRKRHMKVFEDLKEQFETFIHPLRAALSREKLQELSRITSETGPTYSPRSVEAIKEQIKTSVLPWADRPVKAYLQALDSPIIQQIQEAGRKYEEATGAVGRLTENSRTNYYGTRDKVAELTESHSDLFTRLPESRRGLTNETDPLRNVFQTNIDALKNVMVKLEAQFPHDEKLRKFENLLSVVKESTRLFE